VLDGVEGDLEEVKLSVGGDLRTFGDEQRVSRSWRTKFELKIRNGTVHIRHQCRKTTVLSCHRCLINTGVEKAILLKFSPA